MCPTACNVAGLTPQRSLSSLLYHVQDPTVPNALSRKMMQRIVNVDYSFPPSCEPSLEARDLVGRIFVQDPTQVSTA